MSHKNGNGKSLRFAALIRVSTEKQAAQGESLRTQKADAIKDVEHLHGRIVAEYGGQEHATPGHERSELDRLLSDAAKKKFDAVIVGHADRWSRDNAKSKAGLEVLRKHSVRFFVRSQEYDLFNPTQVFFLGMSAEIGEFNAGTQSLKSLENKIARAKRGIPTSGRLPVGRLYDRDSGKWTVDKEIQAMWTAIAKRYLKGERGPKLAEEFGINHAFMCKTLRQSCGAEHVIHFDVPRFQVKEDVTIKVPPLLDAKLIDAVRSRLTARRTYLHGTPKNKYLLGGRVFCAHCGYTMAGQTNHNGLRYYRHSRNRVRECTLCGPMPHVPADGPDGLESKIFKDLFKLFGNPKLIEEAVKSAIPNSGKMLKKRDSIESELAKIDRGRERILKLITKELISDSAAERQLDQLKLREAQLLKEQATLDSMRIPTAADIKQVAKYVQQNGDCIFAYDDSGGRQLGGNDLATFITMKEDDRKHLIETAFSLPQLDGSPAGVYVTVAPGKKRRYTYEIRGQLVPSRLSRASY